MSAERGDGASPEIRGLRRPGGYSAVHLSARGRVVTLAERSSAPSPGESTGATPVIGRAWSECRAMTRQSESGCESPLDDLGTRARVTVEGDETRSDGTRRSKSDERRSTARRRSRWLAARLMPILEWVAASAGHSCRQLP